MSFRTVLPLELGQVMMATILIKIIMPLSFAKHQETESMKDWGLGKYEHAMSRIRVVLGSFCDFILFSPLLPSVSLNNYLDCCCS